MGVQNWLHNPEGWVDHRVVLGQEAFATGTHDHVHIADETLRLTDAATAQYPARGSWTSGAIEPDSPFTELLPSWQVDAPADTRLRMQVRTRDAERGDWSPWLPLATWGRVMHETNTTTRFDGGRVEIDIVRLNRPADAFEVGLHFANLSADTDSSAAVRRVVVVTSGKGSDLTPHHGDDAASKPTARDLPVPFRTQQNNPEAMRPRTCSPTSVAMVMAYRGVDLPTVEHAVGIYDAEYGIFGNWGRAVAWASQHGLDAELVRIRDWRQVEDYIAAGQPLIASIAFGPDEFPSNVMNSTAGHLIVIRGLTPEGDAIVNDPASATRGDGVVYKKEELAAAWFGRGGVTYVIGEAAGSAAPTASAEHGPTD